MLTLLTIPLIVLVVLATWISRDRPLSRPTAQLLFRGFTNDASGVRYGTFTFTNTSDYAVERNGYRILIPLNGNKKSQVHRDWMLGRGKSVAPHTAVGILIAVPSNSVWMVAIPIERRLGGAEGIVREIWKEAAKLGAWSPIRQGADSGSARSTWVSDDGSASGVVKVVAP